MNYVSKKENEIMKKGLALLLVLCMLSAGMLGCAPAAVGGETPAPAGTPTPGGTPAGGAEPTAAGEKTPVKVALCVTGTVNDGGWCQTAYNGLLAAQQTYAIEISYTENLQTTEMESAFTDYAAQGYQIIIGLGYQFGDPALAVAAKYPASYFIIFEGNVEAANVKSCKISNEQSRYLLGYIAAKISKTGVVGFVAGVEQASITKVAEAFKLGAQAANPDVITLIAYTGSFTDIALAKEAALAKIDSHADVISHGSNTGGNGVIAACQERGIYAMGAASDQNYLAPETVVCSDSYSYGDVLVYIVGQYVNEGSIPMGTESYGFSQGIIKLSPFYCGAISEELAAEVEGMIQQIIDGGIVVPIIETPSAN